MTATLTDRQERFVNEYLLDQNATAAAIRAGYSVKTRGAQAAALMNNPLATISSSPCATSSPA